jgi:hypothetical protein
MVKSRCDIFCESSEGIADIEAGRVSDFREFAIQKEGALFMSNAVWFISYKLKKGVSVQDFLLASERCSNEVLSRKKGFISWKVLNDGDTWVDLVTWETMEDAINAEKENGETHPAASEFYSFINFNSLKMQAYTVEKSF